MFSRTLGILSFRADFRALYNTILPLLYTVYAVYTVHCTDVYTVKTSQLLCHISIYLFKHFFALHPIAL